MLFPKVLINIFLVNETFDRLNSFDFMFYYFDFTGWMLTQILTFYDSAAIPPPPFLRRQFPRNTCNNNPPFNAKFTKNFPKFLQQFWMEKKIYIYFKDLYPIDIFKTFEI